MKTIGLSHKGLVRNANEDRLLIKEFSQNSALLAVFDGLGGQPGGELAAQLAQDVVDTFSPSPGQELTSLNDIVQQANDAILTEADKNSKFAYMGCTVITALIRDSELSWAHVGDCRLYLFRAGRLQQLTVDQNMAQSCINDGSMTVEEAHASKIQNLLDQHLGLYQVEPEMNSTELYAGDILLLATDGVHNEVSNETLE
ncbi:MAG: protein phosphatase 2C domain-containing protein, partial [Proteobacteria bacterium]|nr:protein phosphatase 2C domain-containing protein [Pseudomonadota bacterium]